LLAGHGRDAVAGDDDGDEVHGVGGGDGDDGGAFAAARGSERFHGFWKRVLLARETGEEAAAANLAAGFETAEDVEEVAPLGGVGFAGEQVAEEDAIASKELASEGLEGSVGAACLLEYGCGSVELFCEKRPAAG